MVFLQSIELNPGELPWRVVRLAWEAWNRRANSGLGRPERKLLYEWNAGGDRPQRKTIKMPQPRLHWLQFPQDDGRNIGNVPCRFSHITGTFWNRPELIQSNENSNVL